MGSFDFGSCARILIPILLLFLFPTALRFLVTSPFGSTHFRSKETTTRSSLGSTPAADHASLQPLILPKANVSIVTTRRKKKKATAVSAVEEGLAGARSAIRRAARAGDNAAAPPREEIPLPRIYRNPASFYRSYLEMEKRLKVYIYEEGEPPLFHEGPCKNIYSTEGRFIDELERSSSSGGRGSVRTSDPREANLFFLPFSVVRLVQLVYGDAHNDRGMSRVVADYLRVVSTRHPYWNRTAGADHFMLSCHDWGPRTSTVDPFLYNHSIRALCNANTSEGFRPDKDVSIPEINLVTGDIPRQVRSPPPRGRGARPYLAFFAGGPDHGPVRPVLFEHWGGGGDPDVQVHQYLPKGVDYFDTYMLRSRFCLCPSGYEVASPRLAEAVYAECVPVLISEGYVAPFSDVLRYEEFSLTVSVGEIPRLKEILGAVGDGELERLVEGLRAVRRHFVINQPPRRFDVFGMILHSVWLRRLNLKLH